MQSDFLIPEDLHQADFTRLVFHVRFLADFELSLEAFLRLRRGLMQAAEELDRDRPGLGATELFDPPLASDPVARRRFQRPAPSFVLFPPVESFGACPAESSVPLEVLFLGKGVEKIAVFTQTLQRLGKHGLFLGEGPFDIRAIDSIDSSGGYQPLWSQHDALDALAPMVSNCAWWLEIQSVSSGPLALEFRTPTRLLSDGRPLFDPNFEQIFPFILRRVTSMLYAHCQLELINDPLLLLRAAGEVGTLQQELVWEDWRTLSGRQDLGGILGRIMLDGPSLHEILWVLHLGGLLQVGKGASYGAGYYRVVPF